MPDQQHPKKLNIIFAGTPEFAADILAYFLKHTEDNIAAIYTQPDRPAGRGKKLSPSAVKHLIQGSNLDIAIEQPENFKKSHSEYNNTISKLESYKPDLIIVVAYGLILPKAVLELPTYGCINIHASLLPRWRGAAPIQRAIEAGDKQTGIAIQQMELGLDTGDVLAEAKLDISSIDTTSSLSQKLITLACPLLVKVVNNIKANKITLAKQDDNLVTYAHKISKQESFLNFNKSAEDLDYQIRAFNPWPGSQGNLNNNIVKIWRAKAICHNPDYNSENCKPGSIIQANKDGLLVQCSSGLLKISELQFSGGKRISITDALNGKFKDLLKPGSCFS